MLPLDKLKEIVLKNVEKDGFLNHMRAQIRQQTFKIIDGESKGVKENAGFYWKHPQLSNLRKMEYGSLCLELIYEFLDFFKLNFTLDVFKKEVDIQSIVQRKQLENEINFKKAPDSSKALFQNVLTDYIHLLENPSQHFNSSPKMPQKQNYTKVEKEQERQPKEINPQLNASLSSQFDKKDTVEDDKYSQEQSYSYDKFEMDRLEREENEKRKKKEEQEKQEKQEKLKKEQEERDAQKAKDEAEAAKKDKKKPKIVPVVEKEPPPTAVNKIRGSGPKAKTSISTMYNTTGFGGAQQAKKDPFSITGKYGFDMNAGNDPYGFDLDADINPPKDPYAFDINDDIKPSSKSPFAFDGDEGSSKDPYAFDMADAGGGYGPTHKKGKKNDLFDDKKKKNDPKKNKFAGSSGYGDPHSYNSDEDYAYQPKGKGKDSHFEEEANSYLDEDIDEFQDSNRDQFGLKSSKKDSRNPMFTSSEDIVGASQSQGFDQSVQSEILENFDYMEPIKKKGK